MLLAFDTATPHVTVALHDGDRVVAEFESTEAMRHGEMLAPGIAEYFVQNHGWRSGFLALAAIWLVMTMPLVLAFVPRRTPAADAMDEAGAPDIQGVGLTPREGFASPTLYILFFASLVSAMTGVALILNLVLAQAARLARSRALRRMRTRSQSR